MSQYLCLLRDANPRDWSASELQDVIQRYTAWFANLRRSDRCLATNKLADLQGRVVRKNGSGVVVMDGPYAEKEVLGGYFVVEADSYDEAVAMTKDCPHYDFGSIEVRLIENMRPQ